MKSVLILLNIKDIKDCWHEMWSLDQVIEWVIGSWFQNKRSWVKSQKSGRIWQREVSSEDASLSSIFFFYCWLWTWTDHWLSLSPWLWTLGKFLFAGHGIADVKWCCNRLLSFFNFLIGHLSMSARLVCFERLHFSVCDRFLWAKMAHQKTEGIFSIFYCNNIFNFSACKIFKR